MYIFREIRKIRKAIFSTQAFFYVLFEIFSKTKFLNFPVSQWKYLKTYKYLYLLNLKKYKVHFLLSWFVRGKNPGHTRIKTLDKKIRKMTKFKANFRIVKIILWKSYWLTIKNWTFICKKMSKSWPLLVLVSLKYFAEKSFSKCTLRF
jgi:hypothetical protein